MPPVILRPYAKCLEKKLHPLKADSPAFPNELSVQLKDFSLCPPTFPKTPPEDLKIIQRFMKLEYPDNTFTLDTTKAGALSVELTYNDHDHPRMDTSRYETKGNYVGADSLPKCL